MIGKTSILIILYCLIAIRFSYSQDEAAQERIEQLFIQVNLCNEKNDHVGIVRTLVEILKIDGTNIMARQQLLSALRSYLDEVVRNKELLNSCSLVLGEDYKRFVTPVLVKYFKFNESDEVKKLFTQIYRGNKAQFKVHLAPLFEMNRDQNPELYKDIITLLKPYVQESEISEYIFLKLLSEPEKDLSIILNELDLKMENVAFCTDSTEFFRVFHLYNKNNPNRNSNIINQLKANVFNHIKFSDPVFSAVYYYNTGNEEKLNEVIQKINSSNQPLKISFHDLLQIDIKKYPEMAKKLVMAFEPHFPRELDVALFNNEELIQLGFTFRLIGRESGADKIFQSVSLESYDLLKLYNERHFDQFDALLKETQNSKLLNDIKEYDLLNLDLSIDTLRARSLLTAALEKISNNEFQNYDDRFLYDYSKICYKLGINSHDLFSELVNRINPLNTNFGKIVPWAIACIHTGDEDRADRLLSQLEVYGPSEDISYLRSELSYWNKIGFQSKLITDHLLKIRISNEQKGEILYTPEQETNTILGNVTEKNYYALLIGVETYLDKSMNLKFPVNDMKKLKDILTEDYLFNENNIVTLANPDRNKIFDTFQSLKSKISESDNFLVFYAGHGQYEENMEQGFWIPADGTKYNTTNWISNAEIVSLLKGIKAKHTLLIADACFSGSIFITRDAIINYDKAIEIAYSLESKTGLTSGANTPVPDKSIFLEFLLKRLKDNNEKYLFAENLYLDFRDAVTNNSITGQRPLYGELDGDKGGQFIFIKRY